MTIDEAISIAEKQEAILRFPHFDRKDAWELGQLMASRIVNESIKLSASIQLTSGLMVFQYMSEGTTANNVSWMTRKFNVVKDLELSSLLNTLRLKKRNQTLQDRFLDPARYAASGGAFPIHVSGTGIIGAAVVSGLPHLGDHDFLVGCISQFLKIKDVPRIPLNAEL